MRFAEERAELIDAGYPIVAGTFHFRSSPAPASASIRL
jgi:hypothetical protein